jgi:hypothetical protein
MDKQKSRPRRREEGRFSSSSSDGPCVLTHLTHTQSFGVAHFCYCKINDDDDDDEDEKNQRQAASAGCSQVFPGHLTGQENCNGDIGNRSTFLPQKKKAAVVVVPTYLLCGECLATIGAKKPFCQDCTLETRLK